MGQAKYTDHGIPEGSFVGLRAMCTQSYTEANVKNGSQHSASSYYTDLTAGEILDAIIITGGKPISIKAQYLAIRDGGDVMMDWYRDPVYEGGVDIVALGEVFNQNDINPIDVLGTILTCVPTNPAGGDYSPDDSTKPVVTDLGIKKQPTITVLGNSGMGSSTSSRDAVVGLEQILAPNSVYLFRRTVLADTASLFTFSTWYEGGLDLPRED